MAEIDSGVKRDIDRFRVRHNAAIDNLATAEQWDAQHGTGVAGDYSEEARAIFDQWVAYVEDEGLSGTEHDPRVAG